MSFAIARHVTLYGTEPGYLEKVSPAVGQKYVIGANKWYYGVVNKFEDSTTRNVLGWKYVNITKPVKLEHLNVKDLTENDLINSHWNMRKIIRSISVKFVYDTAMPLSLEQFFFQVFVLKKKIENHERGLDKTKVKYYPVLDKSYWADKQLLPFDFDVTTESGSLVVKEKYDSWISNLELNNLNFNLPKDCDLYVFHKVFVHPHYKSTTVYNSEPCTELKSRYYGLNAVVTYDINPLA